jgi:hypothetical protein
VTGRKATATEAIVGFAVGTAETTVAEPLLQLSTEGKVEWNLRTFGAILGGGIAGAGSAVAERYGLKKGIKRLSKTPVKPFNAGAAANISGGLLSAGPGRVLRDPMFTIRTAYRQLDAGSLFQAPKPPSAPAQFLLPGFLP